MARKNAHQSLRSEPLESQVNGQLPPSTIAAQLVERHQSFTSDGRQQQESRATFLQLLKEIKASPNEIEPDAQSNYKLIQVIVEAGLDPSKHDDPFVTPDHTAMQVVACIDVIELIVKRNPQVLFVGSRRDVDFEMPLCTWLLPRILAIAGQQKKNNEIVNRVQAVLASFILDLRRKPAFWREHHLLIRFYRAYIEDLVAIFNESRDLSESQSSSAHKSIPSADTFALFSSDGRPPITLPRDCQIRVLNHRHAFLTLSTILGTLLHLSPHGSASGVSSIDHDSQAWLFKSLSNMWQTRRKSRSAANTANADEVDIFLMHELRTFIMGTIDGSTCILTLRRCVSLFMRVVKGALSCSMAEATKPFTRELSDCLHTVQLLAAKSSWCAQEAHYCLFYELDTLAKANDFINGPDRMRVSIAKLSAYLQNQSNGQLQMYESGNILENQMDDEMPPAKRRKSDADLISKIPVPKTRDHAFDHLLEALGNPHVNGLKELADAFGRLFLKLPEPSRQNVLSLLAEIPCAVAPFDRSTRPELAAMCNCVAIQKDIVAKSLSPLENDQWESLVKIIEDLLDSQPVQRSKANRIMIMIAIKRIALHSSVSQHRDLTSSPVAKWCLQSLRSSSREIRIAAGSTLPAFLGTGSSCNDNVTQQNRIIALDALRHLGSGREPRFCESAILAFGHVARSCGDEELNITIIQLVDYLGDTNPLLSGLAQLELRNLAQAASLSFEDFIRPFWRTVGITVVKVLLTRPQKAQHLADLLSISVDQLLLLTQSEVLPYLILWKKHDLLHRLVKASGNDVSLWDVCMQSRNLTAILALLLAQPSADHEQSTQKALAQVCPPFKDEEISSLFKLDPISLACELLIAAGEANGVARANILDGFKEFTLLVERKGQSTRTSSFQNRLTSHFFENHTLGIMTTFSDVIDNPGQANVEKKRCLRAIQQMISIGRGNIRIALPQIRACLESALLVPHLCDLAFSTWITLLEVLDQNEDLETLVDHIFTAIAQNWDNISASTQDEVYEAVATLLRNHGTLIQDNVSSLPSLASIPIMSKFESQLSKLRAQLGVGQRLRSFSQRCRDENSCIVLQGLRELLPYLEENQQWIHESVMTEQPNAVISILERTLLDACVKFSQGENEILELCARCLGVVGCIDPNRVESTRERHDILPLSNFVQASEAVQFVVYLLENVLLKAFHAVSNPRAQGFLAYVMQELLKFCGFSKETTSPYRPHGSQGDDIYQRWKEIPEIVRNSLTPFVSSRYVLTTHSSKTTGTQKYPIYTPGMSHGVWLRHFVFDLLQKAKGDNAQMIFLVVSRVIKGYDASISSFLLPFITANIIIGGTEAEINDISIELQEILGQSTEDKPSSEVESLKLCSENVFQVLDYLSRWVQAKKKVLAASRNARRVKKPIDEVEEASDVAQIASIEKILSSIPPNIVAERALQCKSYARALFHWEQHFRQQSNSGVDSERYYKGLQDIYSQIDEPDGLEGISTYLQVLSPEQQLLEHRRAGRWMAAQSWYESKLQIEPSNAEYEIKLLECLQQAGQHRMILDRVSSLSEQRKQFPSILSIAAEAAWSSNKWDMLQKTLSETSHVERGNFNIDIGNAMLALERDDKDLFKQTIHLTRLGVARTLTSSSTSSIQTCRLQLLKLHALYEVEQLGRVNTNTSVKSPEETQSFLDGRLSVLGTFVADKQFLLSVRRAVMHTSSHEWEDHYIAGSWMTTAKIARKNNYLNVAYEAVINASQLGDDSAMIEQARLLWKEGEHRKAIQSLQGAIAADAFKTSGEKVPPDMALTDSAATSLVDTEQNLLVAKATLLLATWLDQARQTQSSIINKKYQDATKAYGKWEKGLYSLGRYYNKLFEAEKALPISKQSHTYLSGEIAKLVIENYLRSLVMGCKYLYETLPKLLTLWLDFGAAATKAVSKEVQDDTRTKATQLRPKMLETMNSQVKKYRDKISTYVFYTALSQMITRISHPNPPVFDVLTSIILKVVVTYPQQGLWSLLAVVKSSSTERSQRGARMLGKIKEKGRNIRNSGQSVDLKNLVAHAQKLSEQLLYACFAQLDTQTQVVSLERHLKFSPSLAPCPLVVPLEKTLTASLPTVMTVKNMREHKAFPMTREAVTISSFMDDVLVLNSLQRPRKITVRGSDGRKYGLLCKPKDDLRKDQRLMEFNAMINRSLKKDAESSKRQLYIKTYAVTPLNEECGIIEWVDGLKTIRDLLINLYRAKGIAIDYNVLRELNKRAQTEPDGHKIFTSRLLKMYPPVLHEWFAETFPEPETWFAARLRYTRSCAVASMVGYVLGLGDRHGENILLEENSGGVFHVDFNCLFEKGLTFDFPELVPFRLTHNMVDAFGAYGVEGPFRRSAECAMRVMRDNEDALLTILETFVYDPTTNFIEPRKRYVKGVPETPKDVLDSVQSKVRGLMRGESVPLGVEGHVDALIRQATDEKNLSMMYIGWLAFF